MGKFGDAGGEIAQKPLSIDDSLACRNCEQPAIATQFRSDGRLELGARAFCLVLQQLKLRFCWTDRSLVEQIARKGRSAPEMGRQAPYIGRMSREILAFMSTVAVGKFGDGPWSVLAMRLSMGFSLACSKMRQGACSATHSVMRAGVDKDEGIRFAQKRGSCV